MRLDEVTALQEMTNVSNNLSSIGAAINTLAAVYNVPPLGTDALAGTVSNILVAISATAAGVGGTGNVTLLNSASTPGSASRRITSRRWLR